MIGALFSIIAPVLICAGIGYGWARGRHHFDEEAVTLLITSIGAPCLVFHTLANLTLEPGALAAIAAASLATVAFCGVAGFAVLSLVRWSRRAFLPALMFANTGNMGLPLSLLAFGETGLGLAICVFAAQSSLMFTVGAGIAAGQPSLKALARMPFLYAVVLSLPFPLTGTTPPAFINATTNVLGGITIPLMLITLGVSMARLRVQHLRRSLAISLLRLGLGFVGAILASAAFGLDGVARSVLILQSTMPVAVFNYLFAQRYGLHAEEVAGVVILSTVLSFLSLPLLLWYVL